MTRLERITGLLAGAGSLTIVLSDTLSGAGHLGWFTRWACGIAGAFCLVAILWPRRRRRPKGGPLSCGCWVSPQEDVVFVEADQLYKCGRCGQLWTGRAWSEVTKNHIIPNIMEQR